MNSILFIIPASVIVAGLSLAAKGNKKSGAAMFGLGMAMLIAWLPLRPFEALLRHSPSFQRWAEPRLWKIRLGWLAISCSVGGLMGFLIYRAKPSGGRKAGWDEPGDLEGTDAALAEALEVDRATTMVGMARGGRPVMLESKAREAHMQIIGPTRCGKSQLLFALAAQDMRRDMPVFFMEAKGDHRDFDQFLALAQRCERGHQVRYFNPQDPSRSMTFNPVRKLPGQDATSLANQIARIIGREPTSSGEGQDYYRSVDYAKIQNMAEVFWSTGLDFTLRDCLLYLSNDECRAQALRLCKDDKIAASAKLEFEKNADTTALTSAIYPWTTGSLGDLLNTYAPEIRLEDIFQKGQLAYFAIPIGHLQVLANPLGRMLISGLLSMAAHRQQSKDRPAPASVVLDEFAEFATPAFASFIATVGSAGMWTTLSHQDLGQLKKVQGMDAEAFNSAVYNNTSGCKICFRTPDPKDAEFWASILGTYAATEDTERVQKWLFGTRRTGDLSRRNVEHFKIHPNKLKNLPEGTALVFSPGREDCLVRTARVHTLLGGKAGALFRPFAPEEPGLHLEKALKPAQKEDGAMGQTGSIDKGGSEPA